MSTPSTVLLTSLNPHSANWNFSNPNVAVTFDHLIENQNLHPEVKKYEVFESPEDVLALSVAWKRLRDMGVSPVGKLLDKELFSKVTEDDRMNAATIRDYYSKKFMLKSLIGNGQPLSNFRKTIYKIINGDGKMVTQDAFGPVYYLPSFYEYDCQIDYVKSFVSITQETKEKPLPRVISKSASLIPIKRIFHKTKSQSNMEYWFKDEEYNSANVITITKDNPLLPVWDNIYNNTKVLKISGGYEFKKLDNFEYFKINKWNMVQD